MFLLWCCCVVRVLVEMFKEIGLQTVQPSMCVIVMNFEDGR